MAFLRWAPRQMALGAVVIFMWMTVFFFDLAISYENAFDDIDNGQPFPIPTQLLPPLVAVMLIYTAGIPGIPFSIGTHAPTPAQD